MSELCVILPAYNEAENIIPLMEKWTNESQRLYDKYKLTTQVIFVNDCSTDDTKIVIEQLAKHKNNISIINHVENRGLGEALMSGFLHVTTHHAGCEYICVMDCDNTHYPEFVDSMVEKMESTSADVVIASRYINAKKQEDLSFLRRAMSDSARYFYTISIGAKNVTDYTNGYRLYSTEMIRTALKVYGNSLIEEKTFACTTELLCKLSFLGARFAEVPFTLHYADKKGASKMKVFTTAMHSIIMTKKLLDSERSAN